MKNRYKIPIIVVISFFAFLAITPTFALHVCNGFGLAWRNTHFCNVNGEMIGGYFVLDRNLWTNPVIQLINQIFSIPSCTNNEFDDSLPPCAVFVDAFG